MRTEGAGADGVRGATGVSGQLGFTAEKWVSGEWECDVAGRGMSGWDLWVEHVGAGMIWGLEIVMWMYRELKKSL